MVIGSFAVRLVAYSAAALLSACGGGSGGNMAGTIAQGTSVNGTNFASVSVCGPASTCGSVDSPAAGSFGSNPVPAQLATPGGPTFQGAYSATFPLLFSGYRAAETGLTAIPPGEGATI